MTDLKVLFHDLVQWEIALWAAVDTRLRSDCDLQLTWFEIMQLLRDRDGLRIYDVAQEFGITMGGTSKVVDRIEQAGYCLRSPNPNDRRSALLALTATGKAKVDEAIPVFEDELAQRFSTVLGPGELQRMAAGLRLLRASSLPGDRRLSA